MTKPEYDITLSFAGEDRAYVEELANILKKSGTKVFYDKFEEADLWGKDLGIHFDTVYRKSAKFCIIFISQHYVKKVWTNHELRTVIARAIEQNEEYILPARFDDTEVEGIRSTLGFLDLRTKNPTEVAELVIKKLATGKQLPVSEQFQEKHSDILYTSVWKSFFTSSFGMEEGGSTLSVTITNKLNGPHRYFYEPSFKITIVMADGNEAFHLTNVNNPIKFPVKLEYGEEIKIDYQLNESQLQLWKQMDNKCEFFAFTSTTVGEKFESNKRKIAEIIKSLSF